MDVDRFDQWPAKAVLLCVTGVTVPFLGDKTGKKIVRHPTVAVKTSLTKLSSCFSAAGCHGLSCSVVLWRGCRWLSWF